MRRVNTDRGYVGCWNAGRARRPGQAQVTAYEGARLIVGDGNVVNNGTIVVDGTRIVAAGANVTVPAGATRVNLAGKTVMPMIIDTHVHLSPTRERIIVDLKRRAYYGVSAAMSMGADLYEHAADPQREHSRRGQVPQRGARHHHAGAGPHDSAALDSNRGRSRQGGAGAGGPQGRHRQDLGRRLARQVQEADPGNLRRHHQGSAAKRIARHRAHL